MDSQINTIVSNIVNDLKAYDPEKIILFGSYANGNPHEDSDLDFLVIKNSDEKKTFLRAAKARGLIKRENYLMPIDLLVYTPQEVQNRLAIGDDFIEDIFKEGKTVYAK